MITLRLPAGFDWSDEEIEWLRKMVEWLSCR